MTNDREEVFFSRNVDSYFAIKLIEARSEGDTEYEKFLIASHKLWVETKSLHVALAKEIEKWHKESERMNSLMDTQNLYRPRLRRRDRLRSWVAGVHHPSEATELAVTAVLGFLLTVNLVSALLMEEWRMWSTAILTGGYVLYLLFRFIRSLARIHHEQED